METIADGPLLERAGRLADAHAMYWLRRLEGPIEDVWQAVSTLDGLKKWWILPGTATAFDLHRGGRFSHHWENTITDFKEFEFIDFAENTGAYQGTGGARFELTPIDETATMFMFLDTWGADMTAS